MSNLDLKLNILNGLLALFTIIVYALELTNVGDSKNGRVICTFMIVLAAFAFVGSLLFSFVPAVRKVTCLTWAYIVLMFVLIVYNAVVIVGYITHNKSETEAHRKFDNTWPQQSNDTDAMSDIQNMLHCCGKEGSQDYIRANLTIPSSCYSENNTANDIYNEGCLKKLIASYQSTEWIVILLGWVTLGVELICVLVLTYWILRRLAREVTQFGTKPTIVPQTYRFDALKTPLNE